MIKPLIIAMSFLFLVACSSNETTIAELEIENNDLKSNISELEKQVQTLNEEIEELKFGAGKLLDEAKKLYEENDLDSTKRKINTLIEKHPTTPEATEGKQLLATIENEIKAEEQRKAEEKKKQLEEATKNMRKQVDNIREITWYYDKSTPEYVDVNNLHLYFGQRSNNDSVLRFVIQYADDDWLFIDSYIIKVDGVTYNITPSYGEIKTDNANGGIWEWYDAIVDNQLYKIAKAIAESEEAVIRHQGDLYHDDRLITDSEKKAIKNVLNAYEALGESIDL